MRRRSFMLKEEKIDLNHSHLKFVAQRKKVVARTDTTLNHILAMTYFSMPWVLDYDTLVRHSVHQWKDELLTFLF